VAQETGARSRHRLAALSGSQIKATGFAGGYLLLNGLQSMASANGKRELMVQPRRDPDGNVVVVVKDSGAGIREANLPRLFEPFFTTRSSGMGMGLAISSSILEAHGGQIWVSNNPDGGATFSFSIPPAMTHEEART
jgi:signal transduction histidine kinase